MPDNSLLTETQREFLQLSEEERKDEYSRQQRSYHRQEIRGRLRDGIADLNLIMREMEPEEIEKALELGGLDDADGVDMGPEMGLYSAIGIVYLTLLSRQDEAAAGRAFARQCEKGVRVALNHLGVSVESVDIDPPEITRGEEFSALADLSGSEVAEYSQNVILQARLDGTISEEQFIEAMQEKGLTSDDE